MKFKSRVDLLHNVIVFSTIILLTGIIVYTWIEALNELPVKLWVSFILLIVIAFMLWIRFGTSYEITPEYLKYKTGPIYGKIKITSIRKLEIGKTMFVGTNKPATALNGIIVKYNKFDEIYISPSDNLKFSEALLKINPDIEISYNK